MARKTPRILPLPTQRVPLERHHFVRSPNGGKNRGPTNAELMISESAAMCEGGDASVKKNGWSVGWPVCAVFFGVCTIKHRKGFDSEKLFPLSKYNKGGIPYSGTLLLSLVAEKEGN